MKIRALLCSFFITAIAGFSIDGPKPAIPPGEQEIIDCLGEIKVALSNGIQVAVTNDPLLVELGSNACMKLQTLIEQSSNLCAKVQSNGAALVAISNILGTVTGQLEATCDKLEIIGTNTESTVSELVDVNSNLQDICTKLDGLSNIFESLISDLIATNADGFSNVCEKLEDIALNITSINQNVASLTNYAETITNQLEAVCEKLDSITNIAESLCAKLETNNVLAAHLTNQIEELCSKVETLTSQVDSVCAKLETNNEAQAVITGLLSVVTNQLEQLCTKIEGVTNQLGVITGQLNDVNANLTNITAAIDLVCDKLEIVTNQLSQIIDVNSNGFSNVCDKLETVITALTNNTPISITGHVEVINTPTVFVTQATGECLVVSNKYFPPGADFEIVCSASSGPIYRVFYDDGTISYYDFDDNELVSPPSDIEDCSLYFLPQCEVLPDGSISPVRVYVPADIENGANIVTTEVLAAYTSIWATAGSAPPPGAVFCQAGIVPTGYVNYAAGSPFFVHEYETPQVFGSNLFAYAVLLFGSGGAWQQFYFTVEPNESNLDSVVGSAPQIGLHNDPLDPSILAAGSPMFFSTAPCLTIDLVPVTFVYSNGQWVLYETSNEVVDCASIISSVDHEPICFSTDGGITREAGLIERSYIGTTLESSVILAGPNLEPVPGAVIVPCTPPMTNDVESQLVCIEGCEAHREFATDDNGVIVWQRFVGTNGIDITADAVAFGWSPGSCQRQPIDTCFIPDQYAIVWGWNRAGQGFVQSYNPLTDSWTNHGQATLPGGGILGGYALAFKNDTVEPTLFFQANGTLYKSSPDAPTALTEVGPSANPQFAGSYPCLAFDPAGRLLVGIGSGSTVGEMDPVSGAVTTLGPLIDVRDGAVASVGPGDWFFDPNGRWFLMARDIRGGLFGQSTGTVLWEINAGTLEITRIGNTPAPTSGTGAAWLSANQYLLSTSGGDVYVYNALADPVDPTPSAWSLLTSAPQGINDLANQWVIPTPIRVVGWIDANCADPATCQNAELFTMGQNEITGELECGPFPTNLRGRFGPCQPDGNPYVSDPFEPGGGGGGGASGCDRCPDEVWQEGCSDAGYTQWRRYYDPAGVVKMEYIFGTLTQPVSAMPPGFSPIPCGEVIPGTENVTPFCVILSNDTIYRREETMTDGTVVISWFDENGAIPDPNPGDIVAGECEVIDPLLPVTEQTICYSNETYIRRVKESYVLDPDGLPVLSTFQIIYFNEDGVLWDSGVLNAGDPLPPGEPMGWYIGECVQPYIAFDNVKLCEFDDTKLLLVDSGGNFAEYSFYDQSLIPIPIPVPSAASGADIDNFLLHAITTADELLTINVDTKTTVQQVPLFTNDGSPLGSSAASYDNFLNRMLYYDYGTDSLYEVQVNGINVGEVSLVAGPYVGIVGSGSSMAVNPVDGKVYVSGSNARVYEIDPTVGGPATLVYTGTTCANGMTFDTDGFLYLGCSTGTEVVKVNLTAGTEEPVIDNWPPGVNSLAFYEIVAQQPACFFRRYGILADGTRVVIGDFNVTDDSPRIVAGAVDCCDLLGSGGGIATEVEVSNFPAVQTVDIQGITPVDCTGTNALPVSISCPLPVRTLNTGYVIVEQIPGTVDPNSVAAWVAPANADSVAIRVRRGGATLTTDNDPATTLLVGDVLEWDEVGNIVINAGTGLVTINYTTR